MDLIPMRVKLRQDQSNAWRGNVFGRSSELVALRVLRPHKGIAFTTRIAVAAIAA